MACSGNCTVGSLTRASEEKLQIIGLKFLQYCGIPITRILKPHLIASSSRPQARAVASSHADSTNDFSQRQVIKRKKWVGLDTGPLKGRKSAPKFCDSLTRAYFLGTK
jgi:hypothetical protein